MISGEILTAGSASALLSSYAVVRVQFLFHSHSLITIGHVIFTHFCTNISKILMCTVYLYSVLFIDTVYCVCPEAQEPFLLT